MSSRHLVVHSNKRVYVIESLDESYSIEKELNSYATLIKVPEGMHTYELDEYSLWSAAACGFTAQDIIDFLNRYSRNPAPSNIKKFIEDQIKEFWSVTLKYSNEEKVRMTTKNPGLIGKVKDRIDERNKSGNGEKIILYIDQECEAIILKKDVEIIKEMLTKLSVFIDEIVEEVEENALRVTVDLYDYQSKAVESFISNGLMYTKGRGVITMPPGSGKTLVGLKIIENLKVKTLILVENEDSFNTWYYEIKDKTNLSNEEKNRIQFNIINHNITIASYDEAYRSLINKQYDEKWGLIIYDDAHKLLTPTHKNTAYMYSKYKLALGSILEREDNNHFFIFRAIGPKVYNLTLKELEVNKQQIKVECIEVKLPIDCWEKVKGEKELHSDAKNVNKIKAYKVIEDKFKFGKIVLVTTYIDIGNKFYQGIKDSYIINKDVQPDERKAIVNEINKKKSYRLIVTGLLEKLLLNDLDSIISLSYIGKSEREEYLRIGKLKASNNNKSKIGYYYALVSEKTAEEKVYKERMNRMIKHGYRFKIKSVYDL